MMKNKIFGNELSGKVIKKAEKSKKKYERKFGNDEKIHYKLAIQTNDTIGEILGVKDIKIYETETNSPEKEMKLSEFDSEKGIIVGNIRMGFGHYRISMAMASAAHALGYTPYWMDLNSFTETTGGKVINAQNELYSLGSRISGKSRLFNKMVWEPLNYEGFKKLSYNASDQKNAELMTSVFRDIPKDIPVVATHVWPAQAAIHAGMKNVINAIPDNWPMALHLAEGSLHTVQTHYAYMGYRTLNGMNGDKVLNPMSEKDIVYTGNYVDYEMVVNCENDIKRRLARKKDKKPMRFLLSIGGAGAQKEIFRAIIKYLIPAVKKNKAAILINVGDYRNVWDELQVEIPELKHNICSTIEHLNNWEDTKEFAEKSLDGDMTGIHVFYHANIFEAVYTTNLLIRCTDVLITKPSELSFYPVPKIFIKRVGGHEQWGAIHSAELGDGSYECRDTAHVLQLVKMMIAEEKIFSGMCNNILNNKKMGIYDGAINTVKLAMNRRNSSK